MTTQQRIRTTPQVVICQLCGDKGYIQGVYSFKMTPDGRLILDENDNFIIDEVKRLHWSLFDYEIRDQYPFPKWHQLVQECPCRTQARVHLKIEETLGNPTVPEDAKYFDFKDFERISHCAEALALVKQFQDKDIITNNNEKNEYYRLKPGVLLVGPTGTFKTTLAGVCFKYRVQVGDTAVWVNFNDLIEKIRWTYEDGYSGPPVQSIIGSIVNAKFVVIDDVGSSTRSGKKVLYAEDAIEAVRKIAEHRLNKKQPTIFTSNLSIDEMYAQFGPRAVSRIRGLCHEAVMFSEDYRVSGLETIYTEEQSR